ncbi:hypothetical protein GSH19_05225 [Lactobacillus sp. S2-2]|uniref:phage tail assembly chaperone n=1 Tax=Lactobacillus sp. S2-2 TaxID=2692917 RepID=UPI001F422F4F|nr:hypothetical protein [Lactobacillus sp. S2-2]MCF6515554.1 hypothetical protein [Lactobacillus sp. S2-2]
MAEEKNESIVNTNVSDFLKENVESGEKQKEVKLERFNSPFVIKALKSNEINEIRSDATFKHRNPQGQTISDVNQTKLEQLMIVKSIVSPNLNTKELQESYGKIADPYGTLNEMLMASEMSALNEAISDLNSINQNSTDELVEQVKK